MAFSSPSPSSARVKPVPPPKPVSPSVSNSLKSGAFGGQRGDYKWEKPASSTSVGDAQCVQLQKKPNLHQEDGSINSVKSNEKILPSTLSTPTKTSSLVLWKTAQEDKLVTPSNPIPLGISHPRTQFSAKFPHPAPIARENARPPLLPKPFSIAARNFPKPPVPKRPDSTHLIRRTIQEAGTQTPPFGKVAGDKQESLEKLNICRSSVATFQNLENAPGKDGGSSPIRPPRSPKSKPFTGMPFDFLSAKQNLSPGQKILSLPHGERQKSFLWSRRECATSRPAGKDELCNLTEVRAKSCSLERNASLFLSDFAHFRPGIRHKDPIPPPRRVRKKPPNDEVNPFLSVSKSDNNNFPEYAVVNYGLKKNRRLQQVAGVETNEPTSSHETNTESGDLSPSPNTCNLSKLAASDKVDFSCHSQSNSDAAVVIEVAECTGCDISVRVAQKYPYVQEEEHGDCSTKCVINGSEDSKATGGYAKCSGEDAFSVPIQPASTSVAVQAIDNWSQLTSDSESCETEVKVTVGNIDSMLKDFPDGKGESLSCGTIRSTTKLSQWQDNNIEMVKENTSTSFCFERDSSPFREIDQNSKVLSLGDDSIRVTGETKSLETKLIDKTHLTDCDNGFHKENDSKIVNVANVDFGESELDHSSKSTLVVTVEQSSISSEAAIPLPLKWSTQGEGSLRKSSSESDASPWADALESKRSDEDDDDDDVDDVDLDRNATSTLPMRSRLNASHIGSNDQNRRQSWSDGPKKEISSGGKQRRKRRGRSLWCDEGDLSSGALGDQSSFEDVPVDEKSREASNVRRRLSALFSSFGKNSRKSHASGHKQKEKKVRVISRFHCELHDDESHLKVGKTRVEAKGLGASSENSVCQVSREEEEVVQEMGERQETLEDVGVSQLCMKVDSLDMKRQSGEFGSGSHISEQSFENAPSESENEEMLLPEEKVDSSLSENQRRENKRFCIAQELMSSEKVFVDALRLLCIDFPTAVSNAGLEQKTEIISEADLCKILNNLPQLLRFNEELLQDLRDRISSWNYNQKISDIIVRKGPFLKLYTSYFQNFETQCQYLDECCDSNARFARVVRDFEASPRCQRLFLKHYMLKPIQRLPQYRLLLEEYLAKLDPESTDFEDTKVALGIVCDVADHANRSMKRGDALSKLLQLQSLLKNYAIIKPGRTFLKEGELQKLCRKGMLNRYFILLNDCLLYAAYDRSVQAPGSLKVNNELPLAGMKVEIPVAEDYTNEFSIISVTRSFTLSASSAQERTEWVNALQKAILDYRTRQWTFVQNKEPEDQKITIPKGNEHSQLGTAAPVWIQDCRVTMCHSCTSEFTVTFRRHHCRACGKVVCGRCSANKAPLQYKKFQAARVCDECFESLLQDFNKNTGEGFQRELGLAGEAIGNIRASFKKLGQPAAGKKIQFVPQRLKEVCANDTGSQMSGWLQWRYRKSWKKMWFVLKDQVLYVYKASEDVVAWKSIPILGYQVQIPCELETIKQDEVENGMAFSLTHKGEQPLEFQADNVHSSKRWITAMQEATVLK